MAAGFRFIPARAGNTPSCRGGSLARPVHPRASGEHPHAARDYSRHTGSSPRERGTLDGPDFMDGLTRFIPARAGNTSIGRTAPIRRTGSSPRERGTPFVNQLHLALIMVHPRASGEHGSTRPSAARQSGSSPRERGTQRHCRRQIGLRRFIPARAGNTVLLQPSVQFGARFIPARAGNTMDERALRARDAVHPRASGEHRPNQAKNRPLYTVHPRASGEHVGVLQVVTVHRRFIPARAGNTRCRWSSVARASVHPRASGEHQPGIPAQHPPTGSSPRERGTRSTSDAERAQLLVHPRASGEHPFWKSLNWQAFYDVKQRTGKLGIFGRSPEASAAEAVGGENCTSLKPSKSAGIRRLTPQVSKS